MTHGDKAKAKIGKSSQASAAAKKSSSPAQQAGSKAVEGKGGGQGASQSAAKTESGKISIKKGGNGAPTEKAAAAGSGKEGGGKALKGRVEEPVTFSNPVVASAYRRAVQKYPNAFRKLTD
jgi:hypothetical protein